jgi:hypothetical protein
LQKAHRKIALPESRSGKNTASLSVVPPEYVSPIRGVLLRGASHEPKDVFVSEGVLHVGAMGVALYREGGNPFPSLWHLRQSLRAVSTHVRMYVNGQAVDSSKYSFIVRN